MGKKRHCDIECGAPVDDWINAGLCITHMSVILIFCGAGPILGNGYGI